jgi:hypothetical protein
MDNELKDAVLLDLLRRRLNRAPAESAAARCRVRGVVARFFRDPDDGPWPVSPCDEAARARAQAWAADLNAQRVGHLVLPRLVPPGGHRGPGCEDGKRPAAGRCGDDVRDVVDQFDRKAASTRWAHCYDQRCELNAQSLYHVSDPMENRDLCLDRQRARTCPALAGRDSGPVESRDDGSGPRRDSQGPGGGGGNVPLTWCREGARLCDDNPICLAVCTFRNISYLICTRSKGHTGDHVACGIGDDHNLAVWPQEAP